MSEADGETTKAPGARRIAVLGEMLELGDEAVEAHRKVGRMAAENGVDLVVAVGGDLGKQLALSAGAAGVPDIAMVGDNAIAAAYLESILRPNDVLLVKGSRGGQLWQIAQALTGQAVTGL
ncbi:glutamate ligase domain-containing protein [Streptomyces sp. NPDC054841]